MTSYFSTLATSAKQAVKVVEKNAMSRLDQGAYTRFATRLDQCIYEPKRSEPMSNK
jgi:uncharacterized protein (DUF1778 family)